MTRRLFLAMSFVAMLCTTALAAKTMTFEVYPDAKDEWRWRAKDVDGNTVATSGQGYKAKASATDMIDNFKKDVTKYHFEVYEDAKMQQRFRIKAKNGNVVGASSGSYKTKAEVDKVVEAFKKDVKDATVSEWKTEDK